MTIEPFLGPHGSPSMWYLGGINPIYIHIYIYMYAHQKHHLDMSVQYVYAIVDPSLSAVSEEES